MRHPRTLSLLALGLSALVLAACSGPTFDPRGAYLGTVTSNGASSAVGATVSGATTGPWDVSIADVDTGTTSTGGTCTHDASKGGRNLTCEIPDTNGTLTLDGSLTNGTWAGTATAVFNSDPSNPVSGSFSLTQQ